MTHLWVNAAHVSVAVRNKEFPSQGFSLKIRQSLFLTKLPQLWTTKVKDISSTVWKTSAMAEQHLLLLTDFPQYAMQTKSMLLKKAISRSRAATTSCWQLTVSTQDTTICSLIKNNYKKQKHRYFTATVLLF